MSYLNNAIDFLTNPNGLGFPILIGGGLILILVLMKYSTKSNIRAAKKISATEEKLKNKNLPFKPF